MGEFGQTWPRESVVPIRVLTDFVDPTDSSQC